MSRAAIAVGADGLLIEVHHNPQEAWIDPLNAIGFDDLKKMINQIDGIVKIIQE